ncbi:MAG: hypothetical protein ABW122_15415, partial [Ilumatobacteraceae bacterium]
MARRLAATAFAVGVAVTANLAFAPTPAASRAPAPHAQSVAPTQAPGVGIRIELVEEQYAFEPDAPLHLVYRLTGDLNSLDLGATPEIPATTAPETTAPATTAPAPAEPAPPDPTASPPTDTVPPDTTGLGAPTETVAPESTAPATTVAPVPLLPLTIQVTNYPPLTAGDSAREIDRIIGGDADRDGFGDAIDGIQITDARPLVTYDTDGSAILTV